MKILKISLFCGALYFFLMAVVHALGLKIPGLFIYFNVPSYAYQDKIISLLAFGWAVFFFLAAVQLTKCLFKAILLIGAVALIMLTFINLSTDFSALSENINPDVFHLETGVLFLYWLWLLGSYYRIKPDLQKPADPRVE